MTDEEFVALVVDAVAKVPGAEAVMLGGSRARGDHRSDSDWDFAVYYRGPMDASYFKNLGWPGTVYQPGQWGQVMYGGGHFDLDGRHFDIHYRNLDVANTGPPRPVRAASRSTSSTSTWPASLPTCSPGSWLRAGCCGERSTAPPIQKLCDARHLGPGGIGFGPNWPMPSIGWETRTRSLWPGAWLEPCCRKPMRV